MDNSDIQKFQEYLNKSLIHNLDTKTLKKMFNALDDLGEFSVANYESGGKIQNTFSAKVDVSQYTVKIETTVIERQE